MGLFDMFKKSSTRAGQRFPRNLTTADWFTADKVCQPSQWNKVGEYTVPAQQEITFGANDPVGGGSIAGRSAYIRFDNTSGVQLHGKIRLALTNANETNTIIVAEESSYKFSADQNDRTKAVLVPEFPRRAGEDSKLQVLFYPDGSGSVTVDADGTNTLMLVPVTVYQ